MNEKFLVLERSIQKDLASIEKQYEDLGAPDLSGKVPPKELIFVAYHLHGLYTAFENIFRNVAAAFENHLDPSGWHRQLLQRMQLDLTPLRPAVIDLEMYERLNQMLGFRHVFRAAYGVNLNPVRLQGVLQAALELKPLYREQIERFLEFLRGLE
jgi:hypothetical protein